MSIGGISGIGRGGGRIIPPTGGGAPPPPPGGSDDDGDEKGKKVGGTSEETNHLPGPSEMIRKMHHELCGRGRFARVTMDPPQLPSIEALQWLSQQSEITVDDRTMLEDVQKLVVQEGARRVFRKELRIEEIHEDIRDRVQEALAMMIVAHQQLPPAASAPEAGDDGSIGDIASVSGSGGAPGAGLGGSSSGQQQGQRQPPKHNEDDEEGATTEEEADADE